MALPLSYARSAFLATLAFLAYLAVAEAAIAQSIPQRMRIPVGSYWLSGGGRRGWRRRKSAQPHQRATVRLGWLQLASVLCR